jgi:glucose-6-phosphate dehydrogenase assembly protein OpcA
MWRTVIAATLDSPFERITGASVSAEEGSPSAALLVAWLSSRLDVPVESHTSDGPGITGVTVHTEGGDITLDRPDGRLAKLTLPGWPQRSVALHRRELTELIAEELRRLDPDDIYAETLGHLRQAEPAGTR